MARNNKPGMSQLGHRPFGKEKLEGPKVHHDDHGSHASVPGKGKGMAVPGQAWEREYKGWEPSRNMELVEGSDFNPKFSTHRKTTHLKVNAEDH